MPDSAWAAFHFLRPWWLIALVPAAALMILIVRKDRVDLKWGKVIAPHLLAHLTVSPQRSWGVRPVYLVGAGLILSILALAGPTWRHELPPFVEDKAPLIIALSVSPSMLQTDIAPSRLERAKQKIRDLLSARKGARTGLIAYSGTAHLVMPLTGDEAVITPFLAALTPQIMPSSGNNLPAAIVLAAHALAQETSSGTILVITDNLADTEGDTLSKSAGQTPLLYLAIGAENGAQRSAVRVTADDSDIKMLERRIETHYEAAQQHIAGARWRDEGAWLMLPCLLLSLLWFRPGTTVQWALVAWLLHAPAAHADALSAIKRLWLTPDQQGQLAFNRGDCFAAKSLFTDPMWRGIAGYCAYDYLAAAEAFAKAGTTDGRLALGNAQAHNRQYENAIASYDAVLSQRPGDIAATTNREIVRKALEQREAKRRQQEQNQPTPDLPSDEVRVDKTQKDGKQIQVRADEITSPDAAEAWMRQVQTTPETFLKQKFSIQAARSPPRGSGK